MFLKDQCPEAQDCQQPCLFLLPFSQVQWLRHLSRLLLILIARSLPLGWAYRRGIVGVRASWLLVGKIALRNVSGKGRGPGHLAMVACKGHGWKARGPQSHAVDTACS